MATDPIPDYSPHVKAWMTQEQLAKHLGVSQHFIRVNSDELGGVPLSPGRINSKKRYSRPVAERAMLARIPSAAEPPPVATQNGGRRKAVRPKSSRTASGVERINFRR